MAEAAKDLLTSEMGARRTKACVAPRIGFYPSWELLLQQGAAEKAFSHSRKLRSVSEDGNDVSRRNDPERPGSGT